MEGGRERERERRGSQYNKYFFFFVKFTILINL